MSKKKYKHPIREPRFPEVLMEGNPDSVGVIEWIDRYQSVTEALIFYASGIEGVADEILENNVCVVTGKLTPNQILFLDKFYRDCCLFPFVSLDAQNLEILLKSRTVPFAIGKRGGSLIC